MSIVKMLKSKTIRFGLFLTVASILQVFVPFLPPHLVGPVGAVVGAAVIALRFMTSIPVSAK